MFPISNVLPPLNLSGKANAVILGRRVINTPDNTPLKLSGNTILKNVLKALAPKSREASIKLLSIFSRTLYIGNIINGKYIDTIPIKIAVSVPIKSKLIPNIFKILLG